MTLPAKRESFWLSQKQMAQACGVSPQAFQQWRVAPVAEIGREKFYRVADVVANRLARQAERAQQAAPDAGDDNMDQERMLLTRAQREGQELKNAQLRRELAPVDLIAWVLGKAGNQIGAILDSIPLKVKKVAPRLSALELETIKREVVKAQNCAARMTVDLDDYYAESRRDES